MRSIRVLINALEQNACVDGLTRLKYLLPHWNHHYCPFAHTRTGAVQNRTPQFKSTDGTASVISYRCRHCDSQSVEWVHFLCTHQLLDGNVRTKFFKLRLTRLQRPFEPRLRIRFDGGDRKNVV